MHGAVQYQRSATVSGSTWRRHLAAGLGLLFGWMVVWGEGSFCRKPTGTHAHDRPLWARARPPVPAAHHCPAGFRAGQ
ncbi:hypothetical protein E143388_07365 [Rhodococcus opacus]|nr:hypothetical protein E143388_07365 [Rhodococcus opacus]